MTDNRTTELLRKLLEERGVKWQETINHVNCIFTWWESPTFGTVHAMDNGDGETLFMACLNNCDFTPEQAIAATLGTPISADLRTALDFMRIWLTEDAHLGESTISRELEKAEGLRKLDAIEDAIAATLGGQTAKLTAEQVRETVEKHWHDLSAEYDMPEATALPEYSYDWQAIADELNAVLGNGNADTDDALALLDEIREAGRISYDDYSQLFDAIAVLNTRHQCGLTDEDYSILLDELGVSKRTCKIIEWYEARDRHEIGNNRVRFSCGDFGTCHDKFCPECGARVVDE